MKINQLAEFALSLLAIIFLAYVVWASVQVVRAAQKSERLYDRTGLTYDPAEWTR